MRKILALFTTDHKLKSLSKRLRDFFKRNWISYESPTTYLHRGRRKIVVSFVGETCPRTSWADNCRIMSSTWESWIKVIFSWYCVLILATSTYPSLLFGQITKIFTSLMPALEAESCLLCISMLKKDVLSSPYLVRAEACSFFKKTTCRLCLAGSSFL